jgi:hypothetical protein
VYSQIETTMGYIHIVTDDLRDAMEKILGIARLYDPKGVDISSGH